MENSILMQSRGRVYHVDMMKFLTYAKVRYGSLSPCHLAPTEDRGTYNGMQCSSCEHKITSSMYREYGYEENVFSYWVRQPLVRMFRQLTGSKQQSSGN